MFILSHLHLFSAPMESLNNEDLFTLEFKYYKSKNPLPNFDNVLDLTALNSSEDVWPVSLCESVLQPLVGLKPCKEWKVYQFHKFPGFTFIQDPFLEEYKYYWISRCLQDFPSDKNNETNLSALGAEKGCDLWNKFVSKNCKSIAKDEPLRQLRWTTLGYHYNWTTKEYSEEKKAEFPQDVDCLSQYLAACLGFSQYQAEAAIINYYHTDSTLAGHTDHSELDHSAPLFSISFGQTALFLLGGKTKSVRPAAMYVRSGDICIMSGESRLAYHAVPKILQSTVPGSIPAKQTSSCGLADSINGNSTPQTKTDKCLQYLNEPGSCHCWKRKCCYEMQGENSSENKVSHQIDSAERLDCTKKPSADCFNTSYEAYSKHIEEVNVSIDSVLSSLDVEPFNRYLSCSRINLNIRQVLPPGRVSLNMMSSPEKC